MVEFVPVRGPLEKVITDKALAIAIVIDLRVIPCQINQWSKS